jgi:hypothetical protein
MLRHFSDLEIASDKATEDVASGRSNLSKLLTHFAAQDSADRRVGSANGAVKRLS